jgi:hypothetical protein
MITRFKHKLRLSGFEDRIQQELGLSAQTSTWVSRLANSCAGVDGVDMFSARGDSLSDALFWHLERSGYANLLDTLVENNPLFTEKLAAYRDTKPAEAA